MELQALRYAAMVSAMTFEQLVDTYARYRNKAQPDPEAAREAIKEFLDDDVDESQFGQDTRIVLAATDFSRELITAVMWLIERGIDIRCIRMKPYRMLDGTVLLDVQQLIPLPEAADFIIQIGVKKQAERQSLTDRHDLRLRFWAGLLEYAKGKTSVHANRSPSKDNWISGSIGRNGFTLNYTVRKSDSQVELWIGLGSGQTARNKAAFHALAAQKDAIESDFGEQLEWLELPDADSCRIRYVIEGGYKSPPDHWPAIHARLTEWMVNLDRAMRTRVAGLIF
jgi:hypothetical protein